MVPLNLIRGHKTIFKVISKLVNQEIWRKCVKSWKKGTIVHLIALNPGPLLQPGEHHDGGATLLPHHAPEVSQRLRQWALKLHFCIFSK